jgi:hypothetical protein
MTIRRSGALVALLLAATLLTATLSARARAPVPQALFYPTGNQFPS